MRILSYKKNGKDVANDIQYTHEGKLCRYGSDEEASTGMIKAMGDLNNLASRITALETRVDKISFSFKDKEMKIAVECHAAATNGDDMKITLPKVGWREGIRQIDGTYETFEIPAGIDEEDIEIFKSLEKALEEYVQNGAGQLNFDFEEETLFEKYQ